MSRVFSSIREAFHRMDMGEMVVIGLSVAYLVIFSYFTIIKYYAFKATAWDLGIYVQSLSTALNGGKLFYETPDLIFNPNGSFLGTHFSPIMFLLLPVYAIYPHPETLLVLQSGVIALGAVLVYLIARLHFDERGLAVTLAAVYLLSPTLEFLTQNDFHLEALLPTIFLAVYYFAATERWKAFFSTLILSLTVIEFAAVPAAVMCLVVVWTRRKHFHIDLRKLLADRMMTVALAGFVVSLVWFPLSLQAKYLLNPFTSPIPSDWQYLGKSLSSMLWNVFTNPGIVLGALQSSWLEKFQYLVYLLAPTLFLSFSDLIWFAPAIPWIVVGFLSTNPLHYSIYYQHTAFAIPFVFISVIRGIAKLLDGSALRIPHRSWVLVPLLIVSLLFSVTLSPFSTLSPYSPLASLQVNQHDTLLRQTIAMIPGTASVLTQNDIFPHLADRSNVYLFMPSQNVTIDYILVDTTSFWFQNIPRLDLPSLAQVAAEHVGTGKYGLVVSADGILLFEHGYAGPVKLFIPFKSTYYYSDLTLANGIVSNKELVHRSNDSQGVFWYGPYKLLPPGSYIATFRLQTSSIDAGHLLTIDVAAGGGSNVLASEPIYGPEFIRPLQWQDFRLCFSIESPEIVEFRGLAASNYSNISLESVGVQQTSYDATKCPAGEVTKYGSADLSLKSGRIVNGLLVHDATDPSGFFWYGPYAELTPGNYTAQFVLKVSSLTNGSIMTVDVSANSGTTEIARLRIVGSNFSMANQWTVFKLSFSTSSLLRNVEFRGQFITNATKVQLAFVEVEQR